MIKGNILLVTKTVRPYGIFKDDIISIIDIDDETDDNFFNPLIEYYNNRYKKNMVCKEYPYLNSHTRLLTKAEIRLMKINKLCTTMI